MSLVVNKHDVKDLYLAFLCADKSSNKELKSLKTGLDESGIILAYKQMFYLKCFIYL